MNFVFLSMLLLIASYSFYQQASPGTPDGQESVLSAHEKFRSDIKTADCSELTQIYENYQASMSELDYDFLNYAIRVCETQNLHDQRFSKLRERVYRARQERGFDSAYARLKEERLQRNNEMIAKAQEESSRRTAEQEREHCVRMSNLEKKKEQEIYALQVEQANTQNAKNSYIKKKSALAFHQNMIDSARCADLEKLSEIYWEDFSALNLQSHLLAAVDHCCQQDPYNSDLYQFKGSFIRKCESSVQAQEREKGKNEGIALGQYRGWWQAGSVGSGIGGLIGFVIGLIVKGPN